MTRAGLLSIALASFLLGSCASAQTSGKRFQLNNDSFAFANELNWEYEFTASGEVITHKNEPPPTYSLRCFPMTRAAREFFYHADFRPESPVVSPDEYRALIRAILKRSSRSLSAPQDKITIPGFENLHQFSGAYGDLLKAECGGAWRSFLQRGNWRMVFPVSPKQRKNTAERFLREIHLAKLPIAHVYQFPKTTLNHALLLYSAEENDHDVTFLAYDPNNPQKPTRLTFNRITNAFFLEQNRYFGGGTVRVYEVYRGAVY